jgi:hypothetical protein
MATGECSPITYLAIIFFGQFFEITEVAKSFVPLFSTVMY